MIILLAILALRFSERAASFSVQVTSPSKTTAVEGRLGSLGVVPYGAYLDGLLVRVASRLCRPFDVPLNPAEDYIFLVERGDCSFLDKARNAQEARAKALLVFDNIVEPLRTIGGDKGVVWIPTVLLTQESGLALMQTSGEVRLNLTFSEKKYARLPVKVVLTGNRTIDSTLPAVLSGLRVLAPLLVLKPYYRINQCESCVTFSQPVEGCLGGGSYCAPHPAGTGFLYEVIRQECILTASAGTYFEYALAWATECNMTYTQACEQALSRAQVDIHAMETCSRNSFKRGPPVLVDNTVLRHAQREFWEFAPTSTLYVGDEPFAGEIETLRVQRAACASALFPPAVCWSELCADQCWPELRGNRHCDVHCNTTACNFDDGDCLVSEQESLPQTCLPSCDREADGYCGGACFCSLNCSPALLANAYCDLACNVSACQYDERLCFSHDVYAPSESDRRWLYILVICASVLTLLGCKVAHWKLLRSNRWTEFRSEATTERRLDAQPFSPDIVEFGSGDCAICITAFDLGSPVFKTACRHVFHTACLEEWFRHNPGCPICMQTPISC